MLSCLDEQEVRGILRKQALKAYTSNTIRNLELLLADLRAIRKRGYSVDNEEIEIGLRCVGAPIKDYTGAMIGAISVAAPSARFTSQKTPAVGRLVMEVAAEISETLGYEKMDKSKAS
jgi:DNA-binding IclR family transcriptional regulator